MTLPTRACADAAAIGDTGDRVVSRRDGSRRTVCGGELAFSSDRNSIADRRSGDRIVVYEALDLRIEPDRRRVDRSASSIGDRVVVDIEPQLRHRAGGAAGRVEVDADAGAVGDRRVRDVIID